MHFTTLLLTAVSAITVAATPAPQTPADANDIFARSANAAMSGCNQGNCPDDGKTFDLEAELRDGKWYYWVRDLYANGVRGACSFYDSDEGGCANIDHGRRVCIDWRSSRGHFTNSDGKKICYIVYSNYVCGNSKWVATYGDNIDCTW